MSLLLLFGFAEQGFSNNCSAMEVNITRVSGFTAICQSATYRITITNNGTSGAGAGNFTVTVDPSGNDFATIENMTTTSGFSLVSGLGTGVLTANHGTYGAGTSSSFEIELGFSCDLWDNMNALTGYAIHVIGFSPANSCYEGNLPFDIGFTTVEPDPTTPPDITVDLGEEFLACANLLVSSTHPSCDSDFVLYADFEECISLDNVEVWVSDVGFCNFSYPVPLGNITQNGNSLEIVVDITDCPFAPPPPARPCLGPGNFAGAYGDIIVKFLNLKKTCCGDGGSSEIVFSTTTCDQNSPASCPGETQFTSGIQTVWTPNGGVPDLTITESPDNSIQICDNNQPFVLDFEICNISV